MCEIEKSLCEIGKTLDEIRKSLYEKLNCYARMKKISCEIIIANRELKNCHVRFILTVDNTKSLCEKERNTFDIGFFSAPVRHNQSAESILVGFFSPS